VNCINEALPRINEVIEGDVTLRQRRAALWARAKIYATIGSYENEFYEKAIQDYETLQEMKPDDYEPYLRISEIYLMMGRNEDAILPLNKAISKDPKNVEILRVRGTVFFLDGNYEEASKDFNDAVEFYPTEELYYYQGLAFYHRGELDDSVKALEKSLQIRANQPEVLRFQAQALKEIGDFERALKVLNQALVLDHKHAPTISQKGELLFDAGKPQQSYREFKKCTSLEPWNLRCQIYKSLCNLNTGKFYQGVKDLTQKGNFKATRFFHALSRPRT
jgi:tetratricopeptide (TPR) repeat protein